MTDIEKARIKYKPDKIKFLLVAEAPPNKESGRFFYFEEVYDKDTLFLETMKVLYPDKYTDTPNVRLRKREFLEQFKDEGFYLIDACDSPMEKSNSSYKRKKIRESLPSFLIKLNKYANKEVKIILISATVYDVCADILRKEGFNIINDEMIDFPGSGAQRMFREKFGRVMNKHR